MKNSSDNVIFLEKLFDIGALDLFKHLFKSKSFDKIYVHVGDLLAVTELYCSVQESTQVINAAPIPRERPCRC